MLEADDLSGVIEAIAHLPELAKANILAHLCVNQIADLRQVQALTLSWDEINSSHLLGFINSNRIKSGFPAVDDRQLRAALAEIQQEHTNVTAASIWKDTSPGALMDQIVEVELARNPSGPFLHHLVRSYDSLSEPDLVRISSDINNHVDQADADGADLSQHIDAISHLLDAWDEVNQPVQVYDQHQGHEEGRSKRVYETLRALCLDLANSHGKYGEALRLSEALLRTFPELESVAEVLKSDVAQLEVLDEQQQYQRHAEPLIEACKAAKRELPKLKRSIAESGFSGVGRGPLANIVTAFRNSTSLMTDKSIAFLAVRDFALFINNERDDPELAFRLIDGLLSFTDAKPSKEVADKLDEDRAVLHRNWKMKQLDKNAGNLFAMSHTVGEMLKYAQGSDRTELHQLKAKIDGKKIAKVIKWGIYAAIAAVVGFFILAGEFNQPSSRASRLPSPTRTTPPASTSSTIEKTFDEEIPPVGSGRLLTRSQVRYCVYQDGRLELIRSLTTTNSQIDRFNQLIDDYNLRCSNYRYTVGVLSSIESEATSRSSILRVDARRIVSSW